MSQLGWQNLDNIRTRTPLIRTNPFSTLGASPRMVPVSGTQKRRENRGFDLERFRCTRALSTEPEQICNAFSIHCQDFHRGRISTRGGIHRVDLPSSRAVHHNSGSKPTRQGVVHPRQAPHCPPGPVDILSFSFRVGR